MREMEEMEEMEENEENEGNINRNGWEMRNRLNDTGAVTKK